MCQPVVSVLALTFNQADYVEDMLKGFIKQVTDFEVEYIIHDDASTDGTQEILKEYEEKYPGKFRMIYEDSNQWSKGRKIFREILLPMARGKYIAFCEGDDYWIDRNKLQKQKDFLDQHEDCVCVAHNALIWYCATGILCAMDNYDKSRYLEARDVIDRRHPSIATASKMHRKEVLYVDPLFLSCGEVGDMPADFFAFTKGKIYYMDEIMSVYRYESSGSWSQRVNHNLKKLIDWRAVTLRFLHQYDLYTKEKYTFYVQLYMTRSVLGVVEYLLKEPIPEQKFMEYVNVVREEKNHEYDIYLDQIERIVKLMIYYRSPALEALLKGQHGTDIYLYGAGKYADIMANFLERNHIGFDGFVVNSLQDNPRELHGKKVIELSEYRKKESTLLVVAISSILWEEVLEGIERNGINNWVYPLLIEASNFKGKENEK